MRRLGGAWLTATGPPLDGGAPFCSVVFAASKKRGEPRSSFKLHVNFRCEAGLPEQQILAQQSETRVLTGSMDGHSSPCHRRRPNTHREEKRDSEPRANPLPEPYLPPDLENKARIPNQQLRMDGPTALATRRLRSHRRRRTR